MACLCCFQPCTKLEPDVKDEPVIDIEKIIKRIAWKELEDLPPARLTWKDKLCPLSKIVTLEIDQAFLQVWPSGSMSFSSPSSSGQSVGKGIGLPRIDKSTAVLFQSSFENTTDSVQTYSFRTERQTRSFVELSLQRGFTVGQSLEVDAKIPKVEDYCGVSGKLGGQLQWSFSRGKTSRQEEQVTWSVDNNIVVGPNRIGTASLMVNEYQWCSSFTLPCVVRALPHPCPNTKGAGEKNDANRAISILDGKDGGRRESSGSCVHPPKATWKSTAGGFDDTAHYDEPGHQDDGRDRTNEEEEEDIEVEVAGVLTTFAPDTDTSGTVTNLPSKRSSPMIPVFVRRRSNREMLKVIYVPCASLVAACPDHFQLDPTDSSVATCELRGRCHMVCATEQRVRLEECMLATPADGKGLVVEEYLDDKPLMSYKDRYMR